MITRFLRRIVITARNRLPSRIAIDPTFATIVFITYSWMIVRFFWKLPSWMYMLDTVVILHIFAYSLLYTLFESLVIFTPLLALSFILPATYYKDHFVAQSTAFVWAISIWAVIFQKEFETFRQWPIEKFALVLFLFLLSSVIFVIVTRRLDLLAKLLVNLADRLTIFLYIYIPLSVLALVVLAVHSLIGLD